MPLLSDAMRHSVGAFATHIDDSLRRGEGGIVDKVRDYLTRRLGVMTIQETNFTRVGMKIAQKRISPS